MLPFYHRCNREICYMRKDRYKDRLLTLNLLPINYWLEYLDLIFFFKCKLVDIRINMNNYLSYSDNRTRRYGTLKLLSCKTSLFRDTFFVRIVNLWNAIPDNTKSSSSLFYFSRLKNVFVTDNVRSYKIICPKCRKINAMSVCSC